MSDQIQCFVYKGDKKADHYLYLTKELEQAEIPDALKTMLGELELVLEFELEASRKLPQADTEQVMQSLQDQGYYLQMPREDMDALEDRFFS